MNQEEIAVMNSKFNSNTHIRYEEIVEDCKMKDILSNSELDIMVTAAKYSRKGEKLTTRQLEFFYKVILKYENYLKGISENTVAVSSKYKWIGYAKLDNKIKVM